MAAVESGHNPTKDATIIPFVKDRVRTDIQNFRKVWRFGRWLKDGKRWKLSLAPQHPFSTHEKAKEGIYIDDTSDKAKVEALASAGIQPLKLPDTHEEVSENVDAISKLPSGP